ncbi:hypothetical protein [Bacteroides congonensis]|uniref:hypothetical protein n=1 Tax=Bacteroides congonensis TaxID=1871006 RepID=UPI0026758C39|nr:hypothetical protein [Bacteroides congonensis]
MKKYVMSMLFCLLCISVHAQYDNDITIGIIVPDQQEEIDRGAFRLLATRMDALVETNGISSEANGTFIMYPIVNILERKLVEGGVRNVTMVELELSLFVKQVNTRTLFGSCLKRLKGNGRNLSDAIRNAFSTININDNVYNLFLKQTKEKIADYYSANKDNLLNQARYLAVSQQYEQALALLMTFPQNLKGADEIQMAAIDIYKKYQNQVCEQLILKAEVAVSQQNYEEAASILATIDTESTCHFDALKLIKKIEETIRKEQKASEEQEEKLLNKKISLEKKRIDAIKEIAIAYFSNQPAISYMQIVK